MIDGLFVAKILLVVAAALTGVATYKKFGMKKDNPVEQLAEKIIKEQTGIDIDLSPEDKE